MFFTHTADKGEFETREWTYVKDGVSFSATNRNCCKKQNIIVGHLGCGIALLS
jgi:hypothetical protein